MSVLKEVFKDIVSYFNPRTKRGRIGIAVLLIVVTVSAYFALKEEAVPEAFETAPRLVEIATASNFSGESTLTFIGSVEAVDQANLESEAAGRVTSVPVTIGQRVSAGTVITQLENQSQYANLLQAEGAYEAAEATLINAETGADRNDVSVSAAAQSLQNAERSAVNAYRSAYNTVANILTTTIDPYYSNPDSRVVPGLRISGGSMTREINQARIDLGDTIANWVSELREIDTADDKISYLDDARANIAEMISLVDMLITRVNDTSGQDAYSAPELRALANELSTARATLISTNGALDNAENVIESATEGLERAEIDESNPADIAAANAQIKQALGRLRAAQAEYQKTIIRTPIGGEVTSIEVQTGDFIGMQSPVAVISNSEALEITAFVGETEKNFLSVGSEVMIEDQYTGRVSAISSALNPTTKKTEVKIQTDTTAIASGDTVRLSVTSEGTATEESDDADEDIVSEIVIPITAVKFTASDGTIFVVEDGILVARSVELGDIRGSFIGIKSGIDHTTVFVVDARGLSSGTEVEAIDY